MFHLLALYPPLLIYNIEGIYDFQEYPIDIHFLELHLEEEARNHIKFMAIHRDMLNLDEYLLFLRFEVVSR